MGEVYTTDTSSSSRTAVRLPVTGNTAVMIEIVEMEQHKATLFAWGEDMYEIPLSLSRVNETEDSNVCGARKEVLAELEDQLRIFPPDQRDEKNEEAEWDKYELCEVTVQEMFYEVAEQGEVTREWMEHGERKGVVREVLRKELTWKKQTNRFYQLPF